MSTRAQVRFATREDGVSFNEHPKKINAQFYVHSDGYPEGLGLQIADSIENYCIIDCCNNQTGAHHLDETIYVGIRPSSLSKKGFQEYPHVNFLFSDMQYFRVPWF